MRARCLERAWSALCSGANCIRLSHRCFSVSYFLDNPKPPRLLPGSEEAILDRAGGACRRSLDQLLGVMYVGGKSQKLYLTIGERLNCWPDSPRTSLAVSMGPSRVQ